MSFRDRTDFTGKRAIVTGGSRGLGRCIADTLAELGATVHVFDWAVPTDDNFKHDFQQVDISSSASVNAAVAALPAPATLLVNNAGITRDTTIRKMSDEDWQAVINVNLTGAFHMIRATAPLMGEQGGGRIVNISSINGIHGMFGQANYAAAKAGLIGLTKTVAREYGQKRITCNAIAPGLVLTEMALKLPEAAIDGYKQEAVMKQLPMPQDIADAVTFLLSDAARYVTAQVIKVDAGQRV